MSDDSVRICAYTVDYGEDGPLASVRYTSFGEDGKVNAVEQVHYWNEIYCNCHIESALESGLDVCFMTRQDKKIVRKKVKKWSEI
tara:strand:+ start:58 stop:312 length:255 start_codon:yes stop_codon:yes gene_type:complete